MISLVFTMAVYFSGPMTMLSIVVPLHNEAENIQPLVKAIGSESGNWDSSFELILVDDGSTDSTVKVVKEMLVMVPNTKLVKLSRNFGHQAAVSAGLAHSKGDAVVVMDGDLQDPVSVISEFLARWREGYQVVYGIRTKRKESCFLRASYSMFYRSLSRLANIRIPLDSGDFCLMDRRVVQVLVEQMPESGRFIRGLRSYVGFRQIGVPYERAARKHGTSSYSLTELLKLAADGLFGFSTFPLRIATYIGVAVSFLSFFVGMFFIVHRILDFKVFGYSPVDVPGLASLAVGLFFLSGITLMILGIMGEYLARIYFEVKRRPLFLVDEVIDRNPGS